MGATKVLAQAAMRACVQQPRPRTGVSPQQVLLVLQIIHALKLQFPMEGHASRNANLEWAWFHPMRRCDAQAKRSVPRPSCVMKDIFCKSVAFAYIILPAWRSARLPQPHLACQ